MKPSHFALAVGLTSLTSAAAAADLDSHFAPPESGAAVIPAPKRRTVGGHAHRRERRRLLRAEHRRVDRLVSAAALPHDDGNSEFDVDEEAGERAGQVGYAKQWGMFVLGAEGDFDVVGDRSTNTLVNSSYDGGIGYALTEGQSLRSLGTIRANVGVAPMSDLLITRLAGSLSERRN